MQKNWQHSIHEKEETPPPGAWDTIVHRLHDTPAAGAWATGIYLQEEAPPQDAWQEIAAALDRQESSSWQTAMYNREETPPPGVWAAVSAALDATAAPVIHMRPARKKTFIYYRAAAAVITAVAATALWIWNSNRNTETAALPSSTYTAGQLPAAPAAKEANTATALPPAGTQEKQIAAATAQQQTAATPQQQTAAARNKQNVTAALPAEYAQHTPAAFLPDEPRVFSSSKLPGEDGQVSTDINLMEAPAGTYITISGPDGQSIRVSSKFAGLMGYLSPDGAIKEERLDVIIRESALWKATFRQWREKMQQNTSAPSIGNFMDVLEMSKAVSENE